jgi:glycerol kinase
VMALSPTISIDGGLSQSAYFARFLAAATHRVITVPPIYELTALGLAELCGVNIDSLRAPATHFAPDGFVTDDDDNTFTDAVRRARAWKR